MKLGTLAAVRVYGERIDVSTGSGLILDFRLGRVSKVAEASSKLHRVMPRPLLSHDSRAGQVRELQVLDNSGAVCS